MPNKFIHNQKQYCSINVMILMLIGLYGLGVGLSVGPIMKEACVSLWWDVLLHIIFVMIWPIVLLADLFGLYSRYLHWRDWNHTCQK